MKKQFTLGIALWFATLGHAVADESVKVFAAASLTNVISQIAKQYEQENTANKTEISTSFASSSALAKQIEKGAPADIFISADTQWMQYLQNKKLIQPNSEVNLLGNQLVLIAPAGKGFKVNMDKGFNFAAAFSGKLCTGEPAAVPVGIYGKQSLMALDWWKAIEPRLVGTQDVRSALVLVERGECDAGIVYETDANISDKVEIMAKFPEFSHEPIVYPLGLVVGANSNAAGFYQYLKSPKAKSIFTKFGFTVLVN
jgi:molybdate transport system substrate-binding protein